MSRIIHYLAYNSFAIVKALWSLSFLGLIILNYFVFEKAPSWVLWVFLFLSGLFLGYLMAYRSIKYLQSSK